MSELSCTANDISVVIPVYKSEKILPRLLPELATALLALGVKFEVVLVNDGSPDQSWDAICRLAGQYTWLRGINLTRNYGQHNALLCGIRSARYPIVVTMDDDLQHPPREVRKLVGKLSEGYDVVYGTPEAEEHEVWRRVASMMTKIALKGPMGAAAARNVSAFRAFRTRIRDSFSAYGGPSVSIDVLLSWGTTRFAAIPVVHHPRIAGKTNYTLIGLISHGLNMVTGFSTLPLRLASLVGFSFTLFGIAILLYVVGRYLLQGTSVPGFPFLASTFAIFSGAQLLSLGIIGEYLARMHFHVMGRPAYVIDCFTQDKSSEAFSEKSRGLDG